MSFNKKNASDKRELSTINKVVANGINEYIESREKKVPEFVSTYFSIKGAYHLNKKALGLDILKAPLNIAWMPPYLMTKVGAKVTGKLGLNSISSKMHTVPKGFKTAVEREVNWLIYTELLEIPYSDNNRQSNKDALLETCIAQPEMESLLSRYMDQIAQKSTDPNFRSALERNMNELTNCRTTASDLAGNVVHIASGALAAKQFTPGAMSSGTALANTIAQKFTISNCIFGKTIGSAWYGLFPASASVGLLAATIGTFVVGVGIISAFAGIIMDPIQARLGLHEKRLIKLVKKMKTELTEGGDASLFFKDIYVKYLLEIVDVFRTAALR